MIAMALIIAAGVARADGFVGNMTITDLTTGPYNGLSLMIVTLSSAHANPDSCTHNNTILIKSDSPTYYSNYGMLLTAYAKAKLINAYLAGCYELYPGSGTYPVVYNLTIK